MYCQECILSNTIQKIERGHSAMIRICLDSTLEKYNISRYELAKRTGIQYQVIDNYYKNKVKRYDSYVLERICSALSCKIEEVTSFTKE